MLVRITCRGVGQYTCYTSRFLQPASTACLTQHQRLRRWLYLFFCLCIIFVSITYCELQRHRDITPATRPDSHCLHQPHAVSGRSGSGDRSKIFCRCKVLASITCFVHCRGFATFHLPHQSRLSLFASTAHRKRPFRLRRRLNNVPAQTACQYHTLCIAEALQH